MMSLRLTVIVPTYNRSNRLEKTVRALLNQTLSTQGFEIIIVDDGSEDETRRMADELKNCAPDRIRYYRQENKGPGAARNLGIQNAKTPVVLLLDDDMIPNEQHLELHLDLHCKYPEPAVAVLGNITPGGTGIDLMRRGNDLILGIAKAPGGEPIVSHRSFVTADVSLKRNFVLNAGLFNENIPVVEDMDLAWRLRDLGLKLIYCAAAVAVHTEPLDTIEKVVKEGKKYGRSFAENYGTIPLYRDEIWFLGGRFDCGWNHFSRDPAGYLKDAVRRWLINTYTIKWILRMAEKIPVTNPPKRMLLRCCKEIWAFYYRNEFQACRRMITDHSVSHSK